MYRYAEIIIDISHEAVDRKFTYKIPEQLADSISIGSAVKVPFGKGNTERLGYVIGLTNQVDYDPAKIKAIIAIAPRQNDVAEKSIELAVWLKHHYGSTMIAALKTVMPVKRKVKGRKSKTEEKSESYDDVKISGKNGVSENGRALSDDKIESEQIDNCLEKESCLAMKGTITLSQAQQYIITNILSDKPGTSLIHGITGSGKTEVYMGLIAGMIERGKQSIMLVPEIALTYQNISRFKERFGLQVEVLHSKLSAGERSKLWDDALNGRIQVVIGPRSALFVPFPNLGMIIMDEEHEGSYKSEPTPKYHAREVAEKIAQMNNAYLILGSATPSLESYTRALAGQYNLYELNERLTGGKLPQVYITDLRQELRRGNMTVFSEKLHRLILDRLEKKQQIMLFLNRRGFSGFISCRACGKAVKCPHCDVTMTEHMGGRMVCHYCGHTSIRPQSCPSCGSKYIGRFKAGTEAVEKAIHMTFPQARVLRMDADTTTKKGSYEKILRDFEKGKADILLGTQMIVKGHDFPNVTLVGILAADNSLNTTDFRSAERTFQLITQAAGRAGRGNLPGEVVIQTYQPDSHAIIHGASQNYKDFYNEEMVYRQLMSYPPASHLVAVLVQSKDSQLCENIAVKLAKKTKELAENGTFVIGPGAATISKINDVFRQIFYIKSGDELMLIRIKDSLETIIEELNGLPVSVQFDFDPMTGY